MDEIIVHGGEIFAMIHRVQKLLAHMHQSGSAAGREIEPPQQFLPARFRRGMKLHRGCVGRVAAPSLHRGLEPHMIGTEARRQRLEEGDTRPSGHLAVACDDLAGERHA